MKVKIGPHIKFWGPYQIADLLFPWQDKYNDDCPWADRAFRLGTWLAETKSGTPTWFERLCQWVYDKRSRQIYVKIDAYDTWNMDNTLSYIVVRMLKQLRDTKHGAPHVDDCDVPEHLRSTSAPPKQQEYDLDINHFLRWDWVLAEMIWAFTQSTLDDDISQFFDSKQVDKSACVNTQVEQMNLDMAGLKAHQDRKAHGFLLFGKYYQALWD